MSISNFLKKKQNSIFIHKFLNPNLFKVVCISNQFLVPFSIKQLIFSFNMKVYYLDLFKLNFIFYLNKYKFLGPGFVIEGPITKFEDFLLYIYNNKIKFDLYFICISFGKNLLYYNFINNKIFSNFYLNFNLFLLNFFFKFNLFLNNTFVNLLRLFYFIKNI